MTAAHTFFSLYFSTGKPAPIRNAEGPLVTLPFHPRWLRHSLTMIHFCPHPAPGGLGWSRQSPGGAEMRRIEHRNHRHRSRVERAFSLRRVHFCKPANVLCPTSNPTPGPSISGWINICSSQLSKRSPGPHVVHIFRHCGNVLLDLYIPTPNGSIRQL